MRRAIVVVLLVVAAAAYWHLWSTVDEMQYQLDDVEGRLEELE